MMLLLVSWSGQCGIYANADQFQNSTPSARKATRIRLSLCNFSVITWYVRKITMFSSYVTNLNFRLSGLPPKLSPLPSLVRPVVKSQLRPLLLLRLRLLPSRCSIMSSRLTCLEWFLEYRYNNITLTEMWTGFGCSEELLGGEDCIAILVVAEFLLLFFSSSRKIHLHQNRRCSSTASLVLTALTLVGFSLCT